MRDIEILTQGPVSMYFKNGILDEDAQWFLDNRFQVIDINTVSWTKKNAHRKVKLALNFPDYYGENINAFDDCLSDMKDKRYRGLVIIFRNFDSFLNEDKILATQILDSISCMSRVWLISDYKLISLIQSIDPDLVLPKLGGIVPSWNGGEWLDANRVQRING
jgi:RNAse (barnase) inhibitor barstar